MSRLLLDATLFFSWLLLVAGTGLEAAEWVLSRPLSAGSAEGMDLVLIAAVGLLFAIALALRGLFVAQAPAKARSRRERRTGLEILPDAPPPGLPIEGAEAAPPPAETPARREAPAARLKLVDPGGDFF